MIMLWQQLGHSGSQIKGVHGTLCWFELITSEVAAAIDFYCSVFDWTVEKRNDQHRRYLALQVSKVDHWWNP